MTKRWMLRLGPALLALLAVLVLAALPATAALPALRRCSGHCSGQAGQARPGIGSGEGTPRIAGTSSDTPLPGLAGDPVACRTLADLSAQAAALTGSLALVEVDGRPARAAQAARAIRTLGARAAAVEGGEALTEILGDLAGALEGYAQGDPAASSGVRAASARNAQLRTHFYSCITSRQEETDE